MSKKKKKKEGQTYELRGWAALLVTFITGLIIYLDKRENDL